MSLLGCETDDDTDKLVLIARAFCAQLTTSLCTRNTAAIVDGKYGLK